MPCKAQNLLILSGVDGIFTDMNDKSSLVRTISGKDIYEVVEHIEYFQNYCDGASRKGANGARAKLEYVKEPAKLGTTIYIANSKYGINDILNEKVPCTKIGVDLK